MEVVEAKECGFCFGVDRAVNICLERAKTDGKLYTYGEIIHNETVLKELEDMGVSVLTEETDLDVLERGTVVIRAHGVSRDIYDMLEKMGFEIADATCPFVKKIHRLVSEHSEKGDHIIVTGKKEHPEVKGICGYAKNGRIDVVEKPSDIENLTVSPDEELLVVSQTTFNQNKFKDLVEIIKKKSYHDRVCILNTICNVTENRQNEADVLSRSVDAVLVIGSKGSSNTAELYNICRHGCDRTYLINGAEDLHGLDLGGAERIGITAGASTPKKIIQEVSRYVRDEL